MFQLDIPVPFDCKYPIVLYAHIAWPSNIEHNGKTYWRTGKNGTNSKTYMPVAEYEFDTASDCIEERQAEKYESRKERIWLLSSGNIVDE